MEDTWTSSLDTLLLFQEIVVRVLFILGNLTTKSDETRHNLYSTKASTKYLLMVFQSYFERNVEVRYLSFIDPERGGFGVIFPEVMIFSEGNIAESPERRVYK